MLDSIFARTTDTATVPEVLASLGKYDKTPPLYSEGLMHANPKGNRQFAQLSYISCIQPATSIPYTFCKREGVSACCGVSSAAMRP